MSRTRITSALLAAAALVSGSVLGLGTAHAATTGAAVSVWETTADQSKLLAPQTGTTFAAGGGTGSQTITVNPSTTYQSMTGFGASLTDSSASLIAASPQRNAIMSKLFDPSSGIGLDFLRQPIGASDFALSTYSYDDLPSGQTDPTLAKFSIAHDNSYILPLLQQALSLNPSTTVMATPWSAPGWMKSSGSMIGGSLNSADYQVYANYLVKFLQAYKAAGVPVSLLTAQNEPEYSPSNYPGSTLTGAQEASLIGGYLGPAIKAAGLSTKILAYDHNWDDPSFPETVLGDSTAAQYVSGVAWHCYGGDPTGQTTVHNAYPNSDAYFTECSGSQSSNTANTFSDSLDWQTENLIIGATRNWAKSVVTWNMALNPSGGPSMNCTTCTGVVTVDNNAGTAAYNAEYYVLGQASKFVKPGAVRIDSNTFGSGNIEDVAFRNPDGTIATVVLNADASNAHTFNVSQNGQAFTYTLPAKAVATFTWKPSTSTDATPPTAPAGLTASGTTASSTKLSWTASTDNVGVAGYDVFRNGTQVGTTATTGYTDSGLSASTAYSYTIKAYDAAGNVSGASNTANVTTSSSGSGGGGIDTSKWYQVINTNSGKCADAANSGTSDGTALQQWTCASGNTNQEWQFQATDSGYYKVVSRNAPTEAWNVTGGPSATGDGVPIQLWTYGGGTNEQWKPTATSGGAYTLSPRSNGNECLDVTGVSTADGTRLQQWTCTGGVSQSFTLNAVG
ncbi:RICIN domain-containing protein [Streptomyces sp. SL13]|uniref:RICIN domain-containing protein n=1 Tax=Streptantibioticus silvisoli TaxID=2705255 RepID=A0AA90H8Y8_9ACTN|nr:RICIN domain-containing protein [Streptantibioticus silvisoli]MDI5971015.1 RICIN domain-containing protein [Streptantibioticus silvisoli]